MLWLPKYFITLLFSFMGMMGKLKRRGWEMTLLNSSQLFFAKCFCLWLSWNPDQRTTVSLVTSASGLTCVEIGLERAVSHIWGYSWECRPQGWTLYIEIHWAYLWTLELCGTGARELSFLQIRILRYSRLCPHLFLCHLVVYTPGALKFRLSFKRWEYILYFVFNFTKPLCISNNRNLVKEQFPFGKGGTVLKFWSCV